MKDIQDSNTSRNSRPRQIPGGPYLMRMLHTFAVLVDPKIRRSSRYGPISYGSIGQISDFSKKWSYRKVLLVGSNPSNKSPDNTAFHPDTKSRQFVDKWFEGEAWTVAYENLVDFKTKKNKQLSNAQIKENLEWIVENMAKYNKLGYKIVACGKIAAKGLKMADVDYFEMPHPSGLCRFWNDKQAGDAKIAEMKEWILKNT